MTVTAATGATGPQRLSAPDSGASAKTSNSLFASLRNLFNNMAEPSAVKQEKSHSSMEAIRSFFSKLSCIRCNPGAIADSIASSAQSLGRGLVNVGSAVADVINAIPVFDFDP